jgi:hypothetical protein
MPTYRITAPDGRKFRITGEGSEQEALAQFQAQYYSKGEAGLKLREPGEYDTESREYREKYGPVSASSGLDNFRAGIAANALNRGASLGNMVGLMSDESRAELMQKNAPVMNTTGGKVGGFVGDVASTLPFGGFTGGVAGATAGGAALGLSDPNAQGAADRIKSTALGGALGYAGGKLGQWGANALARRADRMRILKANNAPRLETFKRGSELGLVAPPGNVNPTLFQRFMESFAGKEAVEQEAMLTNSGKMQEAARKFLGLADDAELTPQTLAKIHKANKPAYEEVGELTNKVGGIGADMKYVDELLAIEKKFGGSHRRTNILPEHGEIRTLMRELRRTPFDGNEVTALVRDLRTAAGKSFIEGKKALGHSQREAAAAMERLIERNLRRYARGLGGGAVGRDYAKQVLQNWRNARISDAKAFAVERVSNKATGNLDGAKMAREFARGAPLTGEMRDMARFASAFSTSTREAKRSPGVNALTTLFGAESAMLGHPEPLLLTPARFGMGKLLLSKSYQRAMLPKFKVKAKIPRAAKTAGRLGAVPAGYFSMEDEE